MLAIDTNVVVRYLTGDDPIQSPQARALIDRHDIFVSRTVILESEWVLRAAYGFSAAQVCTTLRAFAGLPNIEIENPAIIAEALDLAEQGVDFADALHLVAGRACDAFATFDRKLIAMAGRLGAPAVADAANT